MVAGSAIAIVFSAACGRVTPVEMVVDFSGESSDKRNCSVRRADIMPRMRTPAVETRVDREVLGSDDYRFHETISLQY